MSLWDITFSYPYKDGWSKTDERLLKLIVDHGGSSDGNSLNCGRRETYGTFETQEAAEACGKASYPLYIQFLSYQIDEVEVTA